MTRLRTIALTAMSLIPIALSPARAGDWPVWRGPRRDGISEEKTAPVRLGPKEGILWKAVPPGEGHSTPIISGDALFLTAAVPAGGESRRVLLRYEKDTGRLVWEREVLKAPLEGKHRKNGYASGTPATDGERVYTAFCGNGRVQAAATLFDGNILWQASPCEFHSIHGFCISPVLHKDLVILNCDQDSAEACIVALDRSTGTVRWRTGRENHLRSYVTPFIAPLAGRDQLLISGSKTVASFDPDTGRRIWFCNGPTEQCVATPVAGHGLVFITGGFPDREILAIRPDGMGDVTGTHILWRAKTGVAYVPSPLLVGDRFYVIRDEGGIACAYEARTGKLLWQERLGGDFSSSLTYAAGNIYAGSEDGILHVFAAEPRFRKVAAVEFGEGIFASPIFSDGRMVLRTTKTLYCFGDPGGSPAAAPENDKDGKATGSSQGTAGPGPRAPAERSVDAAALARVFDPARLPADARLGKPRDLDSYHPWTPITDPQAWRQRAQQVREQVLLASGLWPSPQRTSLQPVIHGEIDRGDYTVAKVHFQSYPGFYVTGNLYRPKGPGGPKRPAVLCPHGHWQNGRLYENGLKEAQDQIRAGKEKTLEGARFPLQARCAQLARMGCVVFFYDMVGNADSTQIGHGQGFRDAEAELRLQSAFGLQTWDSIRAFDFLSGLPDVDPRRIGVTGASGGGTQTFILCAVDDRPAVAFPAVMVSTAMQGGCVCENASYLRLGTGNIELAALCAPRPLGMTGANDWTLEIETKGLPELKALYGALGVPDLVAAKCFPQFEHNYNQVSREVMYNWMNRHLKLGFEEPIQEKPFVPVPPPELRVFDAGHPRPADAVDVAGLRRYLTETSDRELARLRPSLDDFDSLGDFKKIIGRALQIMISSSLPGPDSVAAHELSASEASTGGKPIAIRKLLLSRMGSGEEVPAVVLIPKEKTGAVTVLVHPEGKEGVLAGPDGSLSPLAAGLLERGSTILAIDPFLSGEYHLPGRPTPEPAVNQDFAGYTFGYNRSLLAQRVHDILTAVAYARTLDGKGPVCLVGLSKAGPWALLAQALAGKAVDRTFADLDWFRFEDVATTADPMMLPGALKYGGLPAFAALCAPSALWIAGTSDPMEFTRNAYRVAQAGEALWIDLAQSDAAALCDWLLDKAPHRRESL